MSAYYYPLDTDSTSMQSSSSSSSSHHATFHWKELQAQNAYTLIHQVPGQKTFTLKQLFVLIVVLCAILLVVLSAPWSKTGNRDGSITWSPGVSRNLSEYIRPGVNTALLRPLTDCHEDEFMVVIVPTAPDNGNRRQVIRETWGSWSSDRFNGGDSHTTNNDQSILKPVNRITHPNLYIPVAKFDHSFRVKVIFLMGLTGFSDDVSKEILQEQDKYGDLLVEDFTDTYLNLTLKSVFMLKYMYKSCPKAKYLVKADDDVFLHIPNLQRVLLTSPMPEKLVLGCVICGAKPISNPWNKWYSPSHMFSEKLYPNYVSGTSYVLSNNIVGGLFHAAMETPLFHLEDVFVTGICAKKIGLSPTDNIGFSYQYRPPNPCLFQNATMSHEMSAQNMRKLWGLLHTEKIVKACRTLPKSKIRKYVPTNCS